MATKEYTTNLKPAPSRNPGTHIYPPGNGYISHQTGKGKSSTQNAIFEGYVSSLEGIYGYLQHDMSETNSGDHHLTQICEYRTLFYRQRLMRHVRKVKKAAAKPTFYIFRINSCICLCLYTLVLSHPYH